MSWRVAIFAIVLLGVAGSAFAAPAEHGITGIKPIPLAGTVNEIPDFTPDGRNAIIVKAYGNGAWVYLVMVPPQPGYSSDGNGWNIVFISNRDGQLAETITDSPHTGEDYVRSVVFARGKIDGADATLLITAERRIEGPIPDPAIVTYSVYVLEHDLGAHAGDIEIFRLDRSWDSTQKFCNSDFAMTAEFGLPLPANGAYLRVPDGCIR
jgi:hypothetical protein